MKQDLTMCAVVSNRGLNRALKRWIPWFFYAGSVIIIDPEKNGCTGSHIELICQGRNMAVRDFLQTGCEWLVMFDDDMYPIDETEQLLFCDDKVASCVYYGRKGYGHHHDQFSAGAFRVHRDVLEAIGDPWFGFEPGVCDCLFFERACKNVGYTPVKRGSIGHCIPCVVAPGGEESVRFIPETMFPDIKETPDAEWSDISVHDCFSKS